MPLRTIHGRLSLSDTWLLELWFAFYTTGWGLAFLNPWTDAFAASPRGYLLIGQFPGGEGAFGAFVSVLGTLMLMAVLRGSRTDRAMVAGAAGVFWLCITFLVGVPTSWSAGGIVHFAEAALANWFCWARLRRAGVGL